MFLIALFMGNSVIAQSCLPEGIMFITQAQVDTFQISNPGCIEIEGNVTIKGTNSISNLNGLSMVTSIGSNFSISFNNLLTSLMELSNLNSIGGDLNIFSNDSLISLKGLDNIDANSIINLRIVGNDTLSTCAILCICEYLASPNGTIEIHTNGSGCNSIQEVETACIYLSYSLMGIRPGFSIYPSPSSTQITIELPITVTSNKSKAITIYSANGKQVLTSQMTERKTVVDVAGLPQGIYLVKIISDDGVMVGKFVKQ